jgi:NAD(P)-dependent dehydrogenase (short-subunit alcohol dehydrogenase family)
MQFAGMNAIVTGGASGLGRATVELLTKQGANAAIFDVNDRLGEELAAQTGAYYVHVDLTSREDVAAGFSAAETHHGPSRLLVNCAGISPSVTVLGDERDEALTMFRKTFEVNVVGTYIPTLEFANRIIKLPTLGEERGLIINTASIAAYDGQVGQAAYASSKAALIGLMLPVARELADHAVRVMTIAPGAFDTSMTRSALPLDVMRTIGRQIPFPKRMGTPEEFATLIHSIVTNPMLNGETIRLHGALSLAALRMDDLLVSSKS